MQPLRWPLVSAALLAGTAVMAGAFGAHALRAGLSARQMEIWETAAHYQLAHALALLALSLGMLALPQLATSALARWSSRLLLAGTVIFSGSLYALVLSGVTVLGAVTPIGGTLLIAGWLLLALAAAKLDTPLDR